MVASTISYYNVLERIVWGKSGEVHKAEDLKFGRAVALRFLKVEAPDDAEAKNRFFREARAAKHSISPTFA